ncbi:MAG: radical SAM protein [Epsilonproteobacteria bacterium]|nr:radical SAM protein [Campylobacterota bacterium]NPA56554.1 radical SAM protein [Campylobacterota bacterium]
MRYTFGPIRSRRFGLSLGIDLSPERKSCTFDCLYCELGGAKPTRSIENPPPVEAIVSQVEGELARFPQLDTLTITANGEPTLYPHLDTLITELRTLQGLPQLLILSNSSTITDPSIRESLARLDMVKLSLDCATQRCFKRLDRPLKGMEIGKIIDGIAAFRELFKGLLFVEILVVQGINDREEEFRALREALERIGADRIDLGTIDRPPAYRVHPVTPQRLFQLSNLLEGLPVSIVTRSKGEGEYRIHLNREELLHLLDRRPLSQWDIETLFTSETAQEISRLLEEGEIGERRVGTTLFFERVSKS